MNGRRLVQLLVLIAWSAAFVWLLAGGGYRAYLRPQLWPLLAGGLAMGVMFLMAVLRGGAGHTHHGEGSGYLRAAICLLPLAYALVAPGAPLGGHAFAKRFVEKPADAAPPPAPVVIEEPKVEPEVVEPEPETPPVPPPPKIEPPREAVTPTDLMQLTEDFEFLKDQLVSVEGMVFRQENTPKGRIVLFRFSISCCAADALPLGIYVFHEDLAKFEADAWVRVTGRAVKREVDGKMRESIEATEVTAIEQPANPYISAMDDFGMGF